jgi:hypothetical protein
MISQNELYNKLQFAKMKYQEYSLQLAERYSKGNINKSIPLKLAVISSWLKYLEERISMVTSLDHRDPAMVVLNNISTGLRSYSLSSGKSSIPNIAVIYITDVYNRTIPISKFTVYESIPSAVLIQRILQGRSNVSPHHYPAGSTSLAYGTTDNSIKVVFNNVGANFNGKLIKGSKGIQFNTAKVTGGSNAMKEGKPISYDLISKYNLILDTIAVDLNFVYKNIDRNYSNSINTPLGQSDIEDTIITNENREHISDEHGNTLIFE